MIRKSSAVWRGDGLHGKGELTTQSGAFKGQPYSFMTRFQSEDGKSCTIPRSSSAPHTQVASRWPCRSRSARQVTHPSSSMFPRASSWRRTTPASRSRPSLSFSRRRSRGFDAAKLQTIAEGAKKNCPISRALAATPMTLSAKLV